MPNTHRINSYKDADIAFNSRGPVKSHRWLASERPMLKRRTEPYYKIVKQDGYYDVCLGTTPRGRFYAPVDNTERRLYYSHGGNHDNMYFYRYFGFHTLSSRSAIDKDADVMFPVYPVRAFNDKGAFFSMDALFVDGRLDTSRSMHAPHYRFVSDKADKDKRKAVKEKISNYITLAQMRLPEFIANAELDRGRGAPFGGDPLGYAEEKSMQELVDADIPSAEVIEAFFEMCQNTVNVLASKRAYNQANFNLPYRSYYKAPSKGDDIDKLANPITPEDLAESVHNKILKAVGASAKSKRVEIPQFVYKKEYSYRTTRV